MFHFRTKHANLIFFFSFFVFSPSFFASGGCKVIMNNAGMVTVKLSQNLGLHGLFFFSPQTRALFLFGITS